MVATLFGVGILTLLAEASGAPGGDIWQLGGYVVALMLGASSVYKWGVVPERTRTDKAEARADKEAAEKSEAYKITLPAIHASNDLADRVLTVLPGIEAVIAQSKAAPK